MTEIVAIRPDISRPLPSPPSLKCSHLSPLLHTERREVLEPAGAGDVFLVWLLHLLLHLVLLPRPGLVRAGEPHIVRSVHQLVDAVTELGGRVGGEPGQTQDEAVVGAVMPPVEAALAPVAAQAVQPVPQDGQPRPPVSQDELHPPALPGPAAPQVEEENGHHVVPGHRGHGQGGGGGGEESGQAAAHVAD